MEEIISQHGLFRFSGRLRNTLSLTIKKQLRWALSRTQPDRIKIVYCLTSSGQDLYEAMTLVSLSTLRRTNPLAHVTIICDHHTYAALKASGSPLFETADAIAGVTTPEEAPGYRNRFLKTQLGTLIDVPFLYLDSDTIVRRSLAPLNKLSADIAAAPNHSTDSVEKQLWHEDQAHLQAMGWQVNAPYFNGGVIWHQGTPASRNFSQSWHQNWLDGVQRSGRWRDQTAFNHTLAQASGLQIQGLGHQWNAQYLATPTSAQGARIWHTYSSAGAIAERQDELFFLCCQQVLASGGKDLSAESPLIKTLVRAPSPRGH